MSWRARVILYPAIIGFILPLLTILFCVASDFFGRDPNVDALFYLCPTAVMSMALDTASTGTAIVIWLIIAITNSILYALVAAVPVLFISIWKSD